MIFRKSSRLRPFLVVTTIVLGCSPIAHLQACGPDFPNRYFDAPAEQILAAPEAYFWQEVALIAGVTTPSPRDSGGTESKTSLDDIEELKAVLEQHGLSGEQLETTIAAYAQLRERLGHLSAEDLREKMPADVPTEFTLYLEGARAYKQNDRQAATAAWEQLLALPASERQHRSTWAAYMLGRMATTPEEATARFRQVRELATEGFADSQNLSVASWGWEAKAYLDADQLTEAADLYLRHYQAGAPSALNSLSIVMGRVFDQSRYASDKDNPLYGFARDATARRLWTAYLLSLGTDRYYWDEHYKQRVTDACRQWVRILRDEDVASIDEYDRFAWLAYKSGYLDLAKEWLAIAPPKAGAAPWLSAKIALREGDLPLATRSMEAALRSPELSRYRPLIYAELGRVYLAQDKPQEALTAWLLGGHWEDAAYIAERVLSTDELIAYVNDRLDTVVTTALASRAENILVPATATPITGTLESNRQELRGLLARRLMREDRLDEALAYFDTGTRPEADRYLAYVQSAYDGSRPADARAASFWNSALLTREHGMVLFGTELFPDNKIWNGSFQFWGDPATLRQELARYERGVLAPTHDELLRLQSHPVPNKRYHYRYRAAELGGWAAALLPNNSEDTADVLYTAGSWLKYRDPKAAEPFYQALVIRCPNTPLGQATAAVNWFPPDKSAITNYTYAPNVLTDTQP